MTTKTLNKQRLILNKGHIGSQNGSKNTKQTQNNIEYSQSRTALAKHLQMEESGEDKVHQRSSRSTRNGHDILKVGPEDSKHGHDQQRRHTSNHARSIQNQNTRTLNRLSTLLLTLRRGNGYDCALLGLFSHNRIGLLLLGSGSYF